MIPRASTAALGPAAGALADPKDTYEILEAYRAAIDLASSRKWPQAIRVLQRILEQDEGLAEIWTELGADAVRIDRFDQAADAYARVCALRPSDPAGYLGAAAALLKARRLDEAHEKAQSALDASVKTDGHARAAAAPEAAGRKASVAADASDIAAPAAR